MAVQNIHTFLVHPKTGGEDSNIGGTEVVLEGRLFDLLKGVYEKSENECDIEISFNPRNQDDQFNECRNLIIDYARAPSLEGGRAIAKRLEQATTHRSGLGLLFVIYGKEADHHKIVISRFPADSGILAEEGGGRLNVAFLEKVFLKSAFSYKSAVYKGRVLDAGFWIGRVVDKQITNPAMMISEYWIKTFLDSDFSTSPAQGTRKLAEALREAVRSTNDLDTKKELIAVATLAQNLRGQPVSMNQIQDQFNLSLASRELIRAQIRNPAFLDQQFVFDRAEFERHVPFRSVELDSGAVLTAQSGSFNDVFEQEELAQGKVKFSTTGKIVDEKLRKLRA